MGNIIFALATGGYARHLRKLRRLYADQLRHVSAAVQHHFPPGTRATRPAGDAADDPYPDRG